MRLRQKQTLVLLAIGLGFCQTFWLWRPLAPRLASDDAIIAETSVVDPDPAALARAYTNAIAPLLERYCARCHNAESARGGVNLAEPMEADPQRPVDRWRRVAQAVRGGRMPPSGKPRPTAAETNALLSWCADASFQTACATPRPLAHVALRRLNRAEYNNTLRDLLGIAFQPADDFPADDLGGGFDTLGDVLAVPPLLLEKYLDAAERAVEEAARVPGRWTRILNPPTDTVPFVLRGQPPLRELPKRELRIPGDSLPDPEQRALDHAARAVQAFADRAYRRPLSHEELARFVRFVEASRANGDSQERSVQLALQAILTSPHFLFRVEIGNTDGWLNDFELATRLAYFLWSRPPDDELYQLACHGRLQHEQTLTQQIRRMLRDPNSIALAQQFASQWLQTRGLKELAPDPGHFPQFDEALCVAMQGETERFFAHLVRNDRSVLELLTADYTFANERLAQHYGIAGVQGPQFRKVSLVGTGRGGVLTHASVLAITSNQTRTAPVKRGKWILENLLGERPVTPPPGADNFGAKNGPLAAGTLRQRLERHRTDAACASCHAALDPLGFGLENFDAVGAWRTRDGEHLIDASGTLPDGRSFRDPNELRAILVERAPDFVRCLTEKLLTYGLGRELQAADACTVERIVRRLDANGQRFSSLALGVVTSDAFRKLGSRGEQP
jgi:hypothetical protein